MKYIEKINLNDQDFVFIPPAATAEQIGGIKAENATDENVELKIDEQGKLYAPQYPDFSGKLDKNQGEDNADKVFVINAEGNLEPTEFKGGSDNRLIANVEKVENANINDSYQAKIENLKLYGKSTQGADPSPTNPQEITAISEFSGQVNNGSEQSQPFTYTPSQNMYSTQDGSIVDYVNVENGVEIYYLGIDSNVSQKNWNMASQNDNFIKFQFANVYDNINLNANIPVICNMFNQITVADGDSLTKEGIAKGGSSFIFQVVLNKDRGILTVEDFKTFIQEMIIVYPLATPIEIPIDSEKLTTLRNLYSYTGTTNFLCNAPISFNYEQSVDLVIKDLLSKIQTTGTNLLYLNSK